MLGRKGCRPETVLEQIQGIMRKIKVGLMTPGQEPAGQEPAEQGLPPLTLLITPFVSDTVKGSKGWAQLQRRLTGMVHGVSLFQCQDLMSQTSSPLSQNDSCTGRSADLLLPSGDTGKRQHDRGTEVAPYSRVEHYKAQVSGCFCVSWGPLCAAQCRLPHLWSQRGGRVMHGDPGQAQP